MEAADQLLGSWQCAHAEVRAAEGNDVQRSQARLPLLLQPVLEWQDYVRKALYVCHVCVRNCCCCC
jgi:hypothetical protein